MTTTSKIFTDNMGGTDAASYIGVKGEMFFDLDAGLLRLSDGETVGGIPQTIAAATATSLGSIQPSPQFSMDGSIMNLLPGTENRIGGIKVGPGVNISSDGTLNISSEGLSFNFGDFVADIQDIDGVDVAILKSQHVDQHIIIESNGTGSAKIVGDFEVYATGTNLDNALEAEPILRVVNDGKLRVLVPTVDGSGGALELIGSNSRQALAPSQSGVILHLTGNTNDKSRLYIDGVNDYPIIVGRRLNNTVIAPAQVLAGETIFRIAAQGLTDAGEFNLFGPAKINWVTTEDQTTTSQGGKITIDVTGNGTSAFGNALTTVEFTENGIIAPRGLTVVGQTVLGSADDLTITGGSDNYVLQTNGDGELAWVPGGNVISYQSSLSSEHTITTDDTFVDVLGLVQTVDTGEYRVESSIQYEVIPENVSNRCGIDLDVLIGQIDALTDTTTHVVGYGNGETLLTGTYVTAGAATHTGNIVFDAQDDPDAIFVIRCGAALALSASSSSTLINGARASNIFWLVTGALTIGAGCDIKGTYIGSGAIAPGDVFTLEGRLFTQTGAIAMSNATYSVPTDPTPLILGILATFSVFTNSGAISNTVVNGNVGDVSTGGGAITGFSDIRGTVFNPAARSAKVSFALYHNGFVVPDSVRTSTHSMFSKTENIIIDGIANAADGEDISIKVRVSLGSVVLRSRSVWAKALTATVSVPTGTVTNIVAGPYLTGGTITASGTLAVDATATPTANKIVARDANAMIAATTYKGGTRNAGSFGADSTLTIDFATDNYVLATITGETVTVAYTNIVLGKKVVVMFKNASGTDLDVDSGVSDINSTGGFGTGSIKNNATGQLIVTSFGTTTADLYTDFRI